MPQPFTQRLREIVDPIWEAQHNHPFVTGIGDGSLHVERLRYWVRQDYLYLIDYARVFSIASARAPDLATQTWFSASAKATLKIEMELHRSYARDFGITEEELERELKAPTCQAYTDFLVRNATAEPFEVLVAALLPCFWGYQEIGTRLEDRGLPQNELYARWIQMYTNPDYAREVQHCQALLDGLARDASTGLKEQMERAFVTSSRYEYLFWEMCYNQESWPV